MILAIKITLVRALSLYFSNAHISLRNDYAKEKAPTLCFLLFDSSPNCRFLSTGCG